MLYRGRRPELVIGDVVDFWTVLDCDDERRRLVLRADMKMPGTTVLEMSVAENPTGARPWCLGDGGDVRVGTKPDARRRPG
ncbi:hypothetical protein [Amycolatopsis sp. H20-H5]|uniref:hypothetical protein n=1 Tax=Amycolatopsis sp. H20-H5 TaxID=3046309 RepID=UPI002DB6934D|nr:hypothetical protein [Amycolatopsis sp. H20-H5]MEC3979624.1 hypothetical protein [Amycolatopsis sp. H20-H5]